MSTQTQAPAVVDWKIDASHSTVEFTVRHVLVSTIKGWFPDVTGELHYDPDHVEASWVRATIAVGSVLTPAPGRDEKLRGPDNFDVETYPTATFVSTRVEPLAGNRFRVVGDLTLHGVTRQVPIETIFEGTAVQGNGITRAAFSGHTTVRRTDFGFAAGRPLPGGGITVSDEVALAFYLTCHPIVTE